MTEQFLFELNSIMFKQKLFWVYFRLQSVIK